MFIYSTKQELEQYLDKEIHYNSENLAHILISTLHKNEIRKILDKMYKTRNQNKPIDLGNGRPWNSMF